VKGLSYKAEAHIIFDAQLGWACSFQLSHKTMLLIAGPMLLPYITTSIELWLWAFAVRYEINQTQLEMDPRFSNLLRTIWLF
jgi:hypothetical protein